jgi:tetratricopeptide (TPR) repeat protein
VALSADESGLQRNAKGTLLGNNSADQAFPRSARSQVRSASNESGRRKSQRSRVPSSAGYLVVALTISIVLFFAVWWALANPGEEAPWVPAGLASSVCLLIAFSAREVLMRRAWTRYLLEQDQHEHSSRERSNRTESAKKMHSAGMHAAALRTLQKQSAEADSNSGTAEMHLELFQTCQDYLGSTDEALRSSNLSTESRMAIRTGQEKVRSLQKHHLLTWARDTSRGLTHEAQQRGRMSDKIETANRAMDCLDTALKVYADEPELEASKLAIREFIASVKVAHWVELAERSAFKGHYRRAIDRYKDALFYLGRETVKEDVRSAGAERIMREIELLRARINSSRKGPSSESPGTEGDRL